MCLNILPACVSMYHEQAWRPEKSIGAPGIEPTHTQTHTQLHSHTTSTHPPPHLHTHNTNTHAHTHTHTHTHTFSPSVSLSLCLSPSVSVSPHSYLLSHSLMSRESYSMGSAQTLCEADWSQLWVLFLDLKTQWCISE